MEFLIKCNVDRNDHSSTTLKCIVEDVDIAHRIAAKFDIILTSIYTKKSGKYLKTWQ